MSKKTIAIILARMGSSRFPGKVMAKINGIPVIGHIWERLKDSKKIDGVVVATSVNPENNLIEEYCKENSIPVFRGDEENVLQRFHKCAKEFGGSDIGAVVRITADALFVASEIIDEMVERLYNEELDYIHNRHSRGPPLGSHAEVISFKALEHLHQNVEDREERVHVTLHILNNKNKFKVVMHDAQEEIMRPEVWLLLDEKEDLILIERIYSELGNRVSIKEVLRFLDENPEVLKIDRKEELDHAEEMGR